MDIAFISYEYPPETSGGGIGTYVVNAARMLAERGHQVEVFAGGAETSHTVTPAGVRINRASCGDRACFFDDIVPVFAERHAHVGFDVMEGPEYFAEARGIRCAFPDIPLVVKLHTAQCVLQEVNINQHLTVWDKARFILGGLYRGQVPSPHWKYDPSGDIECLHTLDADVIAAPSRSIRDLMAKRWGFDLGKVESFPYPFRPTKPFLDIDPDTDTNTVTFIGRLEIRKGVLDLMRAIPLVLDQYPGANFRFIGRSLHHPKTGESLKSQMQRELAPYSDAVEFTGAVPYGQIPYYLGQTDICVYPSLYESFGYVCLESIAAARGVVGSCAGGMREILDDGCYGRIIPPQSPRELADAILDLLNHPEERKRLGRTARKRAVADFSYEAIAPEQEACYKRAIAARVTHSRAL